MELGTIAYKNEIYNLDYMTSSEISELLCSIEKNADVDIDDLVLATKLKCIYENKVSEELINQKVNNQLNSMNISIFNINSKFNEKSKNYEKINDELLDILNRFEEILNQIADAFDAKIQELVYKKLELELEKNTQNSEKNKKIIKNITKKHKELETRKENKIFASMEAGGTDISIVTNKRNIKLKNIKNFFSYKFNTYKAIQKNVFEPINQRIEDFKTTELSKYAKTQKDDFEEVENKIEKISQYYKSLVAEKNSH